MAELYKNDKDFLIIKMSHVEAVNNCNLGFRTTRFISKILCDTCNTEITDDNGLYYVAVINQLLCKDCCDDFIKGYNKVPEDEPYEISHYNYYAKILNMEVL